MGGYKEAIENLAKERDQALMKIKELESELKTYQAGLIPANIALQNLTKNYNTKLEKNAERYEFIRNTLDTNILNEIEKGIWEDGEYLDELIDGFLTNEEK